jgi:hypothetical protein
MPDFSASAPANIEPPPLFSAEPSSMLVEARAEPEAEEAVEAAAAVEIFCFFAITLEAPAPFYFFDSTAIVTFLLVAFLFFSSIEARTFGGNLCSS